MAVVVVAMLARAPAVETGVEFIMTPIRSRRSGAEGGGGGGPGIGGASTDIGNRAADINSVYCK